jgi:histidinol dehydrogenase
MARLKLRRIHHADAQAPELLAELQRGLSLQADVVSPRGRELTEQVFGQALTPSQVVERICTDVRRRGLEAVLQFTVQLDRKQLTAETIRVTEDELRQAHAGAEARFLEAIRRIRQNIVTFQSGVLLKDATMPLAGKHELGLRYRPMRRVGVCVPGGAAAYPSTILMTVVPAQTAGVQEIAVVMPPTPNGAYNPTLLATCHELGVKEVYRLGGAQAVAALAYGIQGLPAVDMIVGPGNIFVTLAKKYVFGQVMIDCLAGPSEVIVLADETASAEHIAADLLAQAEHDPASSILITWHEPLLNQVEAALEKQIVKLERAAQAQTSLETFGALVLARDAAQAAEWTNRVGPEHLHIMTRDPKATAATIDSAGAIFLGPYSPVAVGDYAAGPSHVLPTGGTARFASGLSAIDFLRRSSVISFTQEGLAALADDVCLLAQQEGLTAHAASVAIRCRNQAEKR